MKFLKILLLLMLCSSCFEDEKRFIDILSGKTQEEELPKNEIPKDDVETPIPEADEINYSMFNSTKIIEESRKYVSTFIFYSKLFGLELDYSILVIKFGPTPNSLAYCSKPNVNGVPTPTIIIDEAVWLQISPSYKEQMIFHEMAHCILGRTHNGASIDNNSIMNEYLLPETRYISEYDAFMRELFQSNVPEEDFIYGIHYNL